MAARRRTVCLVVLATLALAAPAHAAFPGANGKIAFGSLRDGNYEIYTMNPDGTDQARLTQNPANDDTAVWSPDGRRIAFTSDRAGNNDVFVMNSDGTGQVALTQDPAVDFLPAWSPDGTKIAFASFRDGDSEIYVMNSDGTNQTRITNDSTPDGHPAWSPDGTRIAFESFADGNAEVYTMAPDGSGRVNLTQNSATDGEPTWSPDGSKIAFSSSRSGGEIFVMDATTGSVLAQLTNSTDEEVTPSWSPDGTKIALAIRHSTLPYHNIYSISSSDGSGSTSLSNGRADEDYPDWQRIVPGYPRPKGATPFQTALTIAYQKCVVPTRTHGAPLAFPSCNPPRQASNFLSVGTPDANGKGAKSINTVKFAVQTSPADELISVSLTDVRNKSDLSAYTGEVQLTGYWRITDHDNRSPAGDPATVMDILGFPSVTVPCAATGDPSVGSTCAVSTTANSVTPGIIKAGERTVAEMSQVFVYDGGSDGLASTTGDNTLFMDQGLFVP
jgi:TolB protein